MDLSKSIRYLADIRGRDKPFASRLNIFLITRTIGEQLDANNTANPANKENIACLMNTKIKLKISISRSSLIWWQRRKEDNESL